MKTRIKLGLISLILTVLLLGVYIGYSATPSTSIWISSGTQPTGFDYTVFREGSNYFAKDNFGRIQFDSANATTLIQACLTTGKSIYIRDSTYALSATLQLANNVLIEGESWNTILEVTGSGSYSTGVAISHLGPSVENVTVRNLCLSGGTFPDSNLFNVYNGSYISLEKCKISRNNGTNRALASFQDCRYSRMIDNIFEYAGTDSVDCEAIYINDCTEIMIQRNIIRECSREGIYIDSATNNTLISDNLIQNIGDSGVEVKENVETIQISNNIFRNNVVAVYIIGTTSPFCSVLGNTITNSGNGILCLSDYVVISGNNIFNVSQGVTLSAVSRGVISGNIIRQTLYGIYIYNTENATISGNLCSDSLTNGYGIRLVGSNYTLVVGNLATDNRYGIVETASACNYNNFVANSAFGSITVNIFLSGINSECHSSFNGTTYVA